MGDVAVIEKHLAGQDNYSSHIKTFVGWLAGRTLNLQAVKEYFIALNGSAFTASTVRIKRAAVKQRIRKMMRTLPVEDRLKYDLALKDLDADFDSGAPKINTVEIPRDKMLTVDEYRTLIDRCRSRRRLCFIRFLMTTGCRVSELTGIKVSHCREGETAVHIRVTGKGRKERVVRISGELYQFILDTFKGLSWLFETAGGKPYSRSYVSTEVKKTGRLVGKDISAHTFRHSRITMWVQRYPGSIDAISRYVGHSDISITLGMYCHNPMTDGMAFEEI